MCYMYSTKPDKCVSTHLNADQELLDDCRRELGEMAGRRHAGIENVHIAGNAHLFLFQSNVADHQNQFHDVRHVGRGDVFVDGP